MKNQGKLLPIWPSSTVRNDEVCKLVALSGNNTARRCYVYIWCYASRHTLVPRSVFFVSNLRLQLFCIDNFAVSSLHLSHTAFDFSPRSVQKFCFVVFTILRRRLRMDRLYRSATDQYPPYLCPTIAFHAKTKRFCSLWITVITEIFTAEDMLNWTCPPPYVTSW